MVFIYTMYIVCNAFSDISCFIKKYYINDQMPQYTTALQTVYIV